MSAAASHALRLAVKTQEFWLRCLTGRERAFHECGDDRAAYLME